MLKLTVICGSEGPRFDPYSFQEIIVEDDDKKVVFHQGVIEFIRVEDKSGHVLRFYDNKELEELDEIFEKETGLTNKLFWKAYGRINFPTKCPECGSKKMTWHDEYPGEQIRTCDKCGHVTGYVFNENDIR